MSWHLDEEFEEEAIQLRFRQRIGAVVLDRILRGEHEEGQGQWMRLAGDGHGFLLHRFEQRGLRLWGRAIDFIREQHVAEHWSGLELQHLGACFVREDLRANDVRREQIGGELDALVFEVQRTCERVDQRGLAQTRHAFEQDVTTADDGGEHAVDDVRLPDDDLRHLGADGLEGLFEVGSLLFGSHESGGD